MYLRVCIGASSLRSFYKLHYTLLCTNYLYLRTYKISKMSRIAPCIIDTYIPNYLHWLMGIKLFILRQFFTDYTNCGVDDIQKKKKIS